MTLDWLAGFPDWEDDRNPHTGVPRSVYGYPLPTIGPTLALRRAEKLSRTFPRMYVAFYPFFQFATSPNIWTIMLTTSQEITVTNYTDEAREHLKKLITAMGVTFTSSMRGKLQVS